MRERELRLLRALLGTLRAIQNEIHAIRADQQAKDDHLQQPLPVDLLSEIRPPIAIREYYEAEQHDRQSRWRRWVKPSLEIFGIAIAFALAVFTGLTLREVAKQSALSHEAIDRSTENFRLDERAWVEIDSINKSAEPPARGFPPSFRYRIFLKNVGKTIAKDAVLRRVSSLGPPLNLSGVKLTQEKLLKPSGSGQPPVPPYPLPRAFAPNIALPIPFTLGGAVPQYEGFYTSLVGRIDYTDTFGIPHWMTFCFMIWNAAGDLQYCEYGNDEDRNPEISPSTEKR